MKRILNRLIVSALALLLLAGFGPARASEPLLPDYLTAPGDETGRRTVMFIFAHFDDDSTISGTINMYLRSGWDVEVVWLTSAGTGGYFWGTVEERRAEMEVAADKMGLSQAQRHVLGISDRGCVEHLPEIIDRVTELTNQYQPSVVVTLAYEGGHPDHDSTSVAGYVAQRRTNFKFVCFEVPTYNASGPRLMPYRFNGFIKAYGPAKYVPLDDRAWQVRQDVRLAYKSQWFLMRPEAVLEDWRRMRGQGEPIRETPDYNYLEPPHPGRLYYQSFIAVDPETPFSSWQDAVKSLPEFQSGS
jgi:LmbE family N-acetylglucosaminyl deacetylase